MFTSISRGSSRARPSYICTSCLASILGHAGAQLPSHTSDRQFFSGSDHARGGRVPGFGRQRSTAPISTSIEALNALKKSLLDDMKRQRNNPNEGKNVRASSTAKEVKRMSNPEKVEKREGTETAKDMIGLGTAGKATPAETVKDVEKGRPVKKEMDKHKVTATHKIELISEGKNTTIEKDAEIKETIQVTRNLRTAKITEEGKEIDAMEPKKKMKKRRRRSKNASVATQTANKDELNDKQDPEILSSKETFSPEKGVVADESQKPSLYEGADEENTADRKVLAAKITESLVRAKGLKRQVGASERRAAPATKAELVRQVKSKSNSNSLRNKFGSLETSFRRAGADATRRATVNVIDSGTLSPVDTLNAVRVIPAGLAQRVASTPARTKRTPDSTLGLRLPVRRIESAMNAFSSIKVGLQNKSKRGQLVKKEPPPALEFEPLQRPRPSTQDMSERPVPKPQKAVRTGPMKGKGFDIKTITADELHLTPIEKPQERVPSLSYGLERVLFNPGVYHLQDPRSRVFNFDPYLQSIMPVTDFDFNALKQYITSSRDESLLRIAKEESKKYTGSTSSMTAALAHFHFLLSQWRPVNTGMLSRTFPAEFNSFTALQRGPSAVFLRRKGDVYAIDADKQYDAANILSMLGKSMEKLLTLSTSDFEKYRKQNSDQITEEERNEAETFNYTTIGDFLLRSQLDAFDARLPGTGMFDLKTRAVVSIRMDTKGYEKGMGYEIRGQHGEWESYEREYYDMIRAAFLKYSLQVRMGRMDGIFVAFHNTERIFGFQYISLPEMDFALHGTENVTTGDSEFKLSLELLNKVLDRATEKYPDKSIRLHFETRGVETPFMYIFAEPMKEPQIDEIQASNRAEVLEFEERVLGLGQKTEQELLEERKSAEWEVLRAKVEASMEKDELGIPEVRAIAEDVIQESEYWDEQSPDEKEQRITELLKSFDFGATPAAEQSETIVVDDGEADGTEDEEDGEIEEYDANEDEEDEEDEGDDEDDEDEEDEEEDEEIEQKLAGTELEDSRDEFDLHITDEAEDTGNDSIESFDEKEAIEKEVGEPMSEDSREEMGHEMIEDGENVAPDDTDLVKEDSEIEKTDAEFDDSEHTKDPKQVESQISECQKSEQARDESAELMENEDLLSDEADENKSPAEAPTSDEGKSVTAEPTSPAAPIQEKKAKKAETAKKVEKVEKAKKATKAKKAKKAKKANEGKTEVFAMTLTIRNLVNGEYVERPENLSSNDKWTVEYALVDIAKQRGQRLYESCKRRRHTTLNFAMKETNPFNIDYLRNLRNLSQKGRAWRQDQNEIDAAKGLKVLDGKDESKEGSVLWSEERKE